MSRLDSQASARRLFFDYDHDASRHVPATITPFTTTVRCGIRQTLLNTHNQVSGPTGFFATTAIRFTDVTASAGINSSL